PSSPSLGSKFIRSSVEEGPSSPKGGITSSPLQSKRPSLQKLRVVDASNPETFSPLYELDLVLILTFHFKLLIILSIRIIRTTHLFCIILIKRFLDKICRRDSVICLHLYNETFLFWPVFFI